MINIFEDGTVLKVPKVFKIRLEAWDLWDILARGVKYFKKRFKFKTKSGTLN